jgi:hypothetical protein
MHHHQLRFTWPELPGALRKSSEKPRHFTDIAVSGISEKLRFFGDYLRSFVEIREFGPISYLFCHDRSLCERGIN